MNYTGYCILHDLCTVFVFESEYRDRRSIGQNMARAIESEFAFPGASFDFECYPLESEFGENIWEIAEQVAADAVGQFAYAAESEACYTLHPSTVEVSPAVRDTHRAASAEFGIAPDMARALLDALCEVHGARDESECAGELSTLLKSMTEYYN